MRTAQDRIITEPMSWKREASEDWQDRFEAPVRTKSIEDNAIDGTHPSSKMMDLFLTLTGKWWAEISRRNGIENQS